MIRVPDCENMELKMNPGLLLQNVKGLELIEMENLNTCCGFGGTFAAKFHSYFCSND